MVLFSLRFFGIFYIHNHVIYKHKKFYFFPLDLILIWIYFSCLIELAGTSGTKLHKTVGSEYHLVTIYLIRNAFNISPLSIALVTGFHISTEEVSLQFLVFWEILFWKGMTFFLKRENFLRPTTSNSLSVQRKTKHKLK